MRTFLQICMLFSISLYACEARSLQKGQVAYAVDPFSPHYHTLSVTNGAFVVKATVSNVNNDVISCEVITSVTDSRKILKTKHAKVENIGADKLARMLENCQQLVQRETRQDNDDKTFNHNIVKGKPFSGDFKTGAPSGSGSHMAIFPGTKWCGYENVANSMQDLGVHNETDSCCRTHDHCPYYIDRFESKYHYFNVYPWTISYCGCDQHLYDCLKRVNTPTSNEVGQLFFGLLNVQCFTFEKGEYCADESSILSKLWCSKKTTGERAVMHTFPMKWSDKAGGEAEKPAKVLG